jgi:hypothetical protein
MKSKIKMRKRIKMKMRIKSRNASNSGSSRPTLDLPPHLLLDPYSSSYSFSFLAFPDVEWPWPKGGMDPSGSGGYSREPP